MATHRLSLLLASLLIAALQCWWAKTRFDGDFEVFQRAAARFLDATELYRPSDGHYSYKYAPGVTLAFVPFALFGYRTASLAFVLISGLGLFRTMQWSAARVRQLLSVEVTPLVHAGVFVLTMPFFLHLFALGQSDALILWLAVESETIASSAPIPSGVLAGFAVAFKPPFFLLAPVFALNKEWKRLGGLAGGMAIGLFGGAIRLGWNGNLHELRAWRALLAATTPGLLCDIQNQSAYALACTYLAPASAGGRYYFSVFALGGAITLALLVLAALTRRIHPDAGVHLLKCAALYLAAALSPLGWRTNLITLIPLAYWIGSVGLTSRVSGVRRLVAATVAIVFVVERLNFEVVGKSGFAFLLEHRHYGIAGLLLAIAGAAAIYWDASDRYPGSRPAGVPSLR